VKTWFSAFLAGWPESGGRMGGRTKQFKCQDECQRDWCDIWERRVGKAGKKANSTQALGRQYKNYASTEEAREARL
jgi:hypothetical protein